MRRLIFWIAGTLGFGMGFTAVLVATSIVLTLLVRLGWLIARRKPKRFWKRALLTHLILVPFYAFVVTPAIVAGFLETRSITRDDERRYAGPRIAADGTWVLQSRASLDAE